MRVESGKLRLGGTLILFRGAKPSRGRPSKALPGKVNLIRGNDATKWKMGLATYGRVTFVPGRINQTFVVPTGMTLMGLTGSTLLWNPAKATCSFVSNIPGYAGLAPGTSHSVTLTVSVDPNAPSTLTPAVFTPIDGTIDLNAVSAPTTILRPLVDTTSSYFFYNAVNLLREYGVTGGCSVLPPMFCPNDDVTRAQMAIFAERGAFDQLLPSGTSVVASTTPATFPVGSTNSITISVCNTHFVQRTTTAAVTTATVGKRTIVVTTGSETAVLLNGLTVQ